MHVGDAAAEWHAPVPGCGAGARVDVVQSVASYEDEGGAYIFGANGRRVSPSTAASPPPLAFLEDATSTASACGTQRASAAAAADVASAELHVACSAPSNRDSVVGLKTSLRRGRLLIHDGYALASRAASAPLDAAIGAIAHGPDAEFYPPAVGAALAQDDTLLLVVADRAVGVASRGSTATRASSRSSCTEAPPKTTAAASARRRPTHRR